MTTTSALIAACRREYHDEPTSIRVARNGNGSINLFNVGKFPVVENTYTVHVAGSAKTETTHYSYDLDNGDIRLVTTPSNGQEVRSEHKYAHWRNKHWLEAYNQAIMELNARGFYRQVVNESFRLSAGVETYNGPSAAVDIYELKVSDDYTSGGSFSKPRVNWSYQEDSNQIVLDGKPTLANWARRSYLRALQPATSVTGTVDAKSTWEELLKKKMGAIFYSSVASKIAKQGNATIDEGHFSFSNLRTMSKDLNEEFNSLALRAKPTRPAKDFGWAV